MDDEKYLLEMIKLCMPDLTIKKQDLVKPSPEFAKKFYQVLINELHKRCMKLFNCSIFNDIKEICPSDLNPDMFIYLFTHNILHMAGFQYFNTMDYFFPVHRTKTTIKGAVYFLTFVVNHIPAAEEIVNSFYEKLQHAKMREHKITEIKEDLSLISTEIALNSEKLPQLKQIYDAELKLEAALKEEGHDNEMESLESELRALIENVNSQEEILENLNGEIKLLSAQIVSDCDYDRWMESLNKLESKIKGNTNTDTEYINILEKSYEEIHHFKYCLDIIKEVDIATLDYIKDSHELNLKITSYESHNYEEEINNRMEIFKAKEQNVEDIMKELKEKETKMNNMLSAVELESQIITKQYYSEQVKKEKLLREYKGLKEQLHISMEECDILEAKLNYLDVEHKDIYHSLLTELNSIVQTFVDTISELE